VYGLGGGGICALKLVAGARTSVEADQIAVTASPYRRVTLCTWPPRPAPRIGRPSTHTRSPHADLEALNAFVVKLVPSTPQPNGSIVIHRVQIYHKAHGRLVPAAVVRLGETVHAIIDLHDRLGQAHTRFGTVSLTQ
jgi:hypothetical protein